MTSYKLLAKIKSPKDLKTFSLSELKDLSVEVRKRIIEVLSINGGHLASNLGTVELSIALHYVFDSPEDKMVFDVSHQSYTHKLLTGRNPRFDTIRQHKGLCGFTHPSESEHDHFYAGHAGTAFSLALGLAKKRDLLGTDEHMLPILGDASLTCGLTLEALNNIPNDLKKFIVILNDNKMSISKNVGNIKNILSRLLSNPTSNKLYHELQTLLSKVPGYGQQLAKQGQKFTESLKNLVSPAAFFEQFGLTYVGPIDGHDLKKLVDTFFHLKNLKNPVILHVLTVKGQGMSVAAENPTTYHGVKPFDIGSGKFLSAKKVTTFPKIFGKHILNMAEKDESIVVVNPATLAGSCLNEFMEKFPHRCIDVGIAEGHAVTYSGALAHKNGLKVVASVYATFMQRALDNLFHDVCLQKLPVVFALDRCYISGPDGCTHHGIYDIGFFNCMPNMVITQPRDGQILKELLESSFSWKRPTVIRYPNLATEEQPDKPVKKREFGKAEILALGKDILFIGLGHMNTVAMEVKQLLEKKGLHPTIVDPVFLKPLDSQLFLDLFSKHPFIVTIEEHSVRSGLGSLINNFIMANQLNQSVQILNIGVPDTFVQHGKNPLLYKELQLDAESIAKQIFLHFDLQPKNKTACHDHRTVSQ